MHEFHPFPQPGKEHKSEALPILFAFLIVFLVWWFAAKTCHGQTPNLIVTAQGTSGGLAPGLTLTSDSQNSWKGFLVTGGSSGSYNVLWAESNGTAGGIYMGTVTTSASAAVPIAVAPAPAPIVDGLPLDTLSTAAAAAVASVPAADKATLANSYEALARQIDRGTIVSPLQLQLATGTQLLANFNAQQLDGLKKVTAAVDGWIDQQQCSQKLKAERIGDYARAYHAVAFALGVKRDVTNRPEPAPAPSTPRPLSDAHPKAASDVSSAPGANQSPCANGQCHRPDPAQQPQRFRWFRWGQ